MTNAILKLVYFIFYAIRDGLNGSSIPDEEIADAGIWDPIHRIWVSLTPTPMRVEIRAGEGAHIAPCPVHLRTM